MKNTQQSALEFLTKNFTTEITAHNVCKIRFKMTGGGGVEMWDVDQELGHIHVSCTYDLIESSGLVGVDYLIAFLEANGAIERKKVPNHF